MSNPASRVSAGVPTGGQFAASAKTEAGLSLSDLAREAKANADRLNDEAEQQRALAHRIEIYSLLADYPDDYAVLTTVWPDETNEDGSFDVALGLVLDSEGQEVEDFEGNPGAVPAGFDDGLRSRTHFDEWRVNPDSVLSPVSVGKVKAWGLATFGDRVATPLQKATADIDSLHTALLAGHRDTTSRGKSFADTDVSVGYYGLKDEDGYTKPRGTNGDITLIGNKEVRTFPFGTPSDPDNHETFESARDAAAEVLAEWNG